MKTRLSKYLNLIISLSESSNKQFDSIHDAALKDIIEGFFLWRLWNHVALTDIKRRYRRTAIGPFWTSLSLVIFVSSVGVLYGTLFNIKMKEYLPYLTSGLIVWWPLSGIITEGCLSFINSLGILRQTRLPYSTFVYATVWRNIIIFGHHLVVYSLMLLIFSVPVNLNTLLMIPGLFFLCLNGVWVGMVLSILCSRYRDVQALVPLFMQVLLLITPVFWPQESLTGMKKVVLVTPNIFHHFIDIIRAPMIGKSPQLLSWIVVITVTILGWGFSIRFIRKYMNRIMYWL